MIIVDNDDIKIELIYCDTNQLQLICQDHHNINQRKNPTYYFTAIRYSFYINKSNTLIITALQSSDYFNYTYGKSSIQFELNQYGKLKLL